MFLSNSEPNYPAVDTLTEVSVWPNRTPTPKWDLNVIKQPSVYFGNSMYLSELLIQWWWLVAAVNPQELMCEWLIRSTWSLLYCRLSVGLCHWYITWQNLNQFFCFQVFNKPANAWWIWLWLHRASHWVPSVNLLKCQISHDLRLYISKLIIEFWYILHFVLNFLYHGFLYLLCL